MSDSGDFIPDLRADPQFLFQFTPERITRLLAFFNLAARKLPLERHGLMAGPLTNQKQIVLHDKRCYDVLHKARGSFDAAMRSGSTQLVKVKAKAAKPGGQTSSNSWKPNPGSSTSRYMRGSCTRMKLSPLCRNRVSVVALTVLRGRPSC